MGELFLVLLLTCAVCGGIPLLGAAYLRGDLELPKWLLTVFAFVGMTVIAMLQVPLRPADETPLRHFSGLFIYVFVGYILKKAYGKGRWLFSMLLMLLANGLGLLLACLFIRFAMHQPYRFHWVHMGIFFLAAQAVTAVAYFIAPEPQVKKSKKKKRK